jgi:predicted GNAT superfamily acetyltransferase
VVNRGVEIGIHLAPGLADEAFVALALGNLAAFRLASERKEKLQWQVLRVTGGDTHHFRLVVRHPDRMMDIGLRKKLEEYMMDMSSLSESKLKEAFDSAERSGLKPTPLRTVAEDLDLWSDNFWNWFG